MSLTIIQEDNHLLFVEKPVNMPVQEDQSHDEDLLAYLKDFIKIRDQKPGNVYLSLVHRLDRPVGGTMVFAKTSKAASRLSDMLRRRAIDRTYLAVVRGQVSDNSGVLKGYMVKDRETNTSYLVDKSHKQGKSARLSYKRLAVSGNLSLLEVKLDTGRSHQIRVQLAGMGHPIYGDQKYGQAVNQPGQQIALWATSLELIHPVKKTPVKAISLPDLKAEPWSNFKDTILSNCN